MKPGSLRCSMAVAALVAGSAGAAPTFAAPSPPPSPPPPAADEARSLKHQGDEAMVDRRYQDALAAYREAYQRSPDPVLWYNQGRALQFLARYGEALSSLRRFQSEGSAAARARVPQLDALIAEIRAKVAIVHLRCEVPGARVLIDGREVGVTPLPQPLPVNAGATVVEVFADGYLPFKRELSLAGDEATATLEVALALKSRQGVLAVQSRVPGARVAVDGTPVGMVPAETPLLAGPHRVTVTLGGYDPVATQIVIAAGERKSVSLDPLARKPVYATWWFWTAAGVVVAGAVVTAVALTTEKAPPVGTFSPGLVRF